MRALKFEAARRLAIADVATPEPGPGEVLVRVAACGICGSDLSCYKTGIFAPTILGHEFSGTVEIAGEIAGGIAGDGAGSWARGDRVTVDPTLPCGACDDCRAGASHRCPSSLGGAIGAGRPGAFAEYVVAPAGSLHRIPPGLDLESAALVEPLSVVLHGLGRVPAPEGGTCVVVGLGPIGLLTVAALRAAGAGPILGVDPVDERRALAMALGAHGVATPGAEAAAWTGAAPLVVETSGRPQAVQEAVDLAAAGGHVLLLGVSIAEATVLPLGWVVREIAIVGGIGSTPGDFEAAASLLAADPSLASIATDRVGLEGAPEAFERLSSAPAGGKVLVLPAHS